MRSILKREGADLKKAVAAASLALGVLTNTVAAPIPGESGPSAAGIRKLGDVVLYEDPKFYASFPSLVRRPDGELLVAFRHAPERRKLGESGTSHTDPNSYLVLIRSHDAGQTWSREPELIFAHPFGGSQDPCMVQLRDGAILCSSYAWSRLQPAAFDKLKQPLARAGDFAFLGGFFMRSEDGAKSWRGPIIPPACRGEANLDIFGQPLPAYNRGAMCEGKDGRLYWVVASSSATRPRRSATHLLISADQGNHWSYSCVVAEDEKIDFNETSLYETARGDLVAFTRTENFNDHTVIGRSRDHGQSFKWVDAGFQGHPHHAIRLPDDRVLLVYGYRHAPFGVRARVLDSECENFATAPEIVLRDDGGNGDLGYPWAAMIAEDRALVVYYFNRADGPRHIAGTFLHLENMNE
jgi:hypothetical protein